MKSSNAMIIIGAILLYFGGGINNTGVFHGSASGILIATFITILGIYLLVKGVKKRSKVILIESKKGDG